MKTYQPHSSECSHQLLGRSPDPVCVQVYELIQTRAVLNRKHLFVFQSPLGIGIYDVFISDWMEVLGREKFFIFQTEEFEADPRKILRGIFGFLDLGEFQK